MHHHASDDLPAWLRLAAYAGAGDGLEKRFLRLGFMPLTDCAPLVIAAEQGFFHKHGLDVVLCREASWATVRDKVSIQALDGAQMLAGMPIAASLGLGNHRKATLSAFALGLNGNAITVSQALYQRLLAADPIAMTTRPISATALKRVIDADKAAGRAPMTFATVFPVSAHNYQLRYWMAAAGIDPDHDVRLIVIPPPLMAANLGDGTIVGYCAGEPWNAYAVAAGIGRTLITGYELWNNAPEKVFAVNREWAERHPRTHNAVLMALLEAAIWLDVPENRPAAARILARRDYVNAPLEVIQPALTGEIRYVPEEAPAALADFNVFHRYAANFPWPSHGAWFITQMLRWGQLDEPLDILDTAREVFRPDLYRAAAAGLGVACPEVDHKREGVHAAPWRPPQGTPVLGPDLFFDGGIFDPLDPVAHLERFWIHNRKVSLDALRRFNAPPKAKPALTR